MMHLPFLPTFVDIVNYEDFDMMRKNNVISRIQQSRQLNDDHSILITCASAKCVTLRHTSHACMRIVKSHVHRSTLSI